MTPAKAVRNLAKRYTITHKKTQGDFNDVLQRGRLQKHRVAKDAQGKEFFPDRRRMKPSTAGSLGKSKEITGTAKKLYVNHGVEARGLGGRGRRRSKH